MKLKLGSAAIACASLLGAAAANATVINPSFEGILAPWVGSTGLDTGVVGTVGGIAPTDGSFQAGMVAAGSSDASLETFLGLSAGQIDAIVTGNAIDGAAITQTITVGGTTKVMFDWNFLSDEIQDSSFVDTAFVSFAISGAGTGTIIKLADTSSPSAGAISLSLVLTNSIDNFQTGYVTSQIILPGAGTYILGFGVVNEGDTTEDSGLLIDNVRVPEPGTLALFGLGLAGFGFARRKRNKAA